MDQRTSSNVMRGVRKVPRIRNQLVSLAPFRESTVKLGVAGEKQIRPVEAYGKTNTRGQEVES